jgi:hypothetical protein
MEPNFPAPIKPIRIGRPAAARCWRSSWRFIPISPFSHLADLHGAAGAQAFHQRLDDPHRLDAGDIPMKKRVTSAPAPRIF